MNNHKVEVAKSLSYSDCYEVRCSCGFFKSISKTNIYTNKISKVREEARYIKMDHLEDQKTEGK
jgi:hypothetical protein